MNQLMRLSQLFSDPISRGRCDTLGGPLQIGEGMTFGIVTIAAL